MKVATDFINRKWLKTFSIRNHHDGVVISSMQQRDFLKSPTTPGPGASSHPDSSSFRSWTQIDHGIWEFVPNGENQHCQEKSSIAVLRTRHKICHDGHHHPPLHRRGVLLGWWVEGSDLKSAMGQRCLCLSAARYEGWTISGC